MKIEVLVADDHAIIREGLKKILADTSDMVVAGEAANGDAALKKVREREWGLVILDMSMPGHSGLELIKLMKAERPSLPILVFSMHQKEQFAARAIRAGASGYLSKEADSDMLLPTMREVAAGGTLVSDKVARLLESAAPKNSECPAHTLLSDREYGIFSRIVRGASMTEIANELCLSVKTVSTHKSHILAKMGVAGQVDLVRYAIEHKLMGGE